MTAYKELTKCARLTLEKFYEHQQFQDAAGFYDIRNNTNRNSNTNPTTTNFSFNSIDSCMNKMKKICQKCLTWQYAKSQLELAASQNLDNSAEKTDDLIMDLFLLNDQFTSAKYLIKKLNLGRALEFKLDFGHLKHRLLNLNCSSSIIVLDLDSILKECISFGDEDENEKKYLFEICSKLLNEFKDLNELNNQVLVSLCDFLLNNYKHLLSSETKIKELKVLQCTARIFQLLVSERISLFDSYKRHHSSPLLIIEQLLMNSHIDLCSKTIKMCRESLQDSNLNSKINLLLLKYAHKALEFKIYAKNKTASSNETNSSNRSPVHNATSVITKLNKTKTGVVPIIDITAASNNITPNSNLFSSSPSHTTFSSSFKNIYKFAQNNTNSSFNAISSSHQQTPPQNSTSFLNNLSVNSALSSNSTNGFVMPAMPPTKEEWVKDEDVNEVRSNSYFYLSFYKKNMT